MVKDIPGIFLGQSHGHAEFLLYKCVQKPPRKISKTVGTNRRNFCLVLGHVLMLSTDSPTDKNRGKDYCISDLLMIYYRKRETSDANRCLPDGPIDGLPGLSDRNSRILWSGAAISVYCYYRCVRWHIRDRTLSARGRLQQ